MLSKQFLLKIEENLKGKNFVREDFIIDQSKSSGKTIVSIKYSYMPEYVFRGTIDESGESFNIEFTPGSIVRTQKKTNIAEWNFLSEINNWLNNILGEWKANPIARKFNEYEELLKQFQNKILEMDDDKNNYFTV